MPSFSSLLTLLAFAAWLVPVNALYFYMEGNGQKCFFEELPKDTLVVGEYMPCTSTPSGFRALPASANHRNRAFRPLQCRTVGRRLARLHAEQQRADLYQC